MALHGLGPQTSHRVCSEACLDGGFGGKAQRRLPRARGCCLSFVPLCAQPMCRSVGVDTGVHMPTSACTCVYTPRAPRPQAPQKMQGPFLFLPSAPSRTSLFSSEYHSTGMGRTCCGSDQWGWRCSGGTRLTENIHTTTFLSPSVLSLALALKARCHLHFPVEASEGPRE